MVAGDLVMLLNLGSRFVTRLLVISFHMEKGMEFSFMNTSEDGSYSLNLVGVNRFIGRHECKNCPRK